MNSCQGAEAALGCQEESSEDSQRDRAQTRKATFPEKAAAPAMVPRVFTRAKQKTQSACSLKQETPRKLRVFLLCLSHRGRMNHKIDREVMKAPEAEFTVSKY